MERWRLIPGWSNYTVSDYGRVRRLSGFDAARRYRIKGGLIKPIPVRSGSDPRYRPLYVSLSNGGRARKYKISRLVLLAFEGPPPSPDRNCARHYDDDQKNNCLDNLFWGSQKDNGIDRVRNGRSCPGERNGNSRWLEADIKAIRRAGCLIPRGRGQIKNIADQLGLPYKTVWNVLRGVTWCYLEG